MIGSRMFVAATLVLLVGIAPAYAQHRGSGRARGGAVVVGRAAPHGEGRVAPRVYSAPRAYAGQRVVRVAPVRFYRPYYTFRPRLSLGFGLSLGYPVRYSSYYGYYDPFYYPRYSYGYAYPYPYPYPYSSPYPYPSPYSYPSPYPAYPPPAYPGTAYPPGSYPPSAYPPGSTQPAYPQSGYPPQGSISPSQPNTGGMSFEIQPMDAQIYVDGRYVGTVGQFSPTSQPLGLTAGRHHIRITAPGYRAMEFDADIMSGEVLPYQGILER
jgi:PEGA domain